MKFYKAIIRIPDNKGDSWKISFTLNGKGGSPFLKNTASAAYLLLERKFIATSASQPDAIFCVSVRDNEGIANETLDTGDLHQVLYATVCFLEDYISESFLKKRARIYLGLGPDDVV